MIVFSVVDEFQNGYFYRLNIFKRDDQGSGFVEGLCEGKKYIHLRDWVIIPENALEISIFNAICEF